MQLYSRLVLIIAFVLGGLLYATPAAAKNFNIRIADLRVRDTRSAHKDTIWSTLSVFVNGTKKGSVAWNGTCDGADCEHNPQRDLNNGLFTLGLAFSVDTGEIAPTDKVTIAFTVVNKGGSDPGPALETAADQIGQSTCVDFKTCVATKIVQTLLPFIFANCDGPIAEDRFDILGSGLDSIAPAVINQPGNFGSIPIPGTDGGTFYGSDSASGCGHNSNYAVHIGVYRKS
jgi:hypothetical protein